MPKKTQAEMIGLYAGLLVKDSVEYEDAIENGESENSLYQREHKLRNLCSQLRNLVVELMIVKL